jgi:hypothetical protein
MLAIDFITILLKVAAEYAFDIALAPTRRPVVLRDSSISVFLLSLHVDRRLKILHLYYSHASKVLDRGSLSDATRHFPPLLQHLITMPTQRRFGQELDQNARRGPNISPAARLEIIAKRSCGVPLKELADEFGRSVSAIKYTI